MVGRIIEIFFHLRSEQCVGADQCQSLMADVVVQYLQDGWRSTREPLTASSWSTRAWC
jgi:hypothetical protein